MIEWIESGGPGLSGRPVFGGGVAVREVSDERGRLAIAGDCGAELARLRAALDAVAAGRWAELTGWAGSYWVVAEQAGGRRFVCGDLAGVRGLWHARDRAAGVVWSSDLARLAARVGASVDLELLAARLAVGGQHWPTRSPWAGVQRVPGGWGLVLDRSGVRLVDVRNVGPEKDVVAGAGRLGEALRVAVQRRVRLAGGPVGADLSGGLDSSASVLLAAEVGSVHAVTYTDALTSAEDALYAARVAVHTGVRHTIAQGGSSELPFGLKSAPATAEPAAAVVNLGMDRCYLEPVAGLPVHLTGHGGDVVLDSSAACWVGQIQRRMSGEARRGAHDFARLRNVAPGPYWQSLKKAAASTPSRAAGTTARQLRAGGLPPTSPGWAWCRPGQGAGWLTAPGRRAVADLLDGTWGEPVHDGFADDVDQWAALWAVGDDARAAAPLYDAIGVRPVHPFLDNQVVRAAFAIPAYRRRGTYTYKPVLAAAVELPDWLIGRRSKGSFTAQRIQGLARHRRTLEELVTDNALAASGLVNAGAVRSALAETAAGRTADPIADLHHLVIVCQWLRGSVSASVPLAAAC
ncbi:asparagine synthase-related protein [Kitasatospora sp. NBC_01300]|uniref:asparagine synthase-related protein n=1 Tax=Kitasatospora sp. NBC_01300 TaxID=2903574 RepID=UPI002F91B70F|nr:asparagine synthase-related protein [Kitasatospora sp. NBC_01300]